MEILIKAGKSTEKGRCIVSTKYLIYSTNKLFASQIKALIRSIDSGQDIIWGEKEINKSTSLLYKYIYDVEITLDSSD